MSCSVDLAAFTARMRRERLEAGLPERITDPSALATVAALITSTPKQKSTR